MGGVMIDGCGIADSFYVLKPLTGQMCRSCGKKEYALMEVKRKIRVFYVPTVSINTKYAVACQKCKEGFYISEEQKDYILRNSASCVEVLADGVHLKGMDKANVIDVTPVPDFSKASQQCVCGAQLKENARFCTKCGAKVAADIDSPDTASHNPGRLPQEELLLAEDVQPEGQSYLCSGCGERMPMTAAFCTKCGAQKGSPVPEDTVPLPEIHTCRNCGAGMSETAAYCNRCGTRREEPTQEAEDIPKGRVCRSCGADLSDIAVYCTRCGSKQEEDPEEEAVDVPQTKKEVPQVTEEVSRISEILTPPAEEPVASFYRRGKVCPECGIRALPGRETCGICGSKLE